MRRRLSTRERVALFQASGGLCHLCGGRITVGEAWEVEHVIPLAQGGEDGGDNLKPAHRTCHRRHTAEVDIPAIAKTKRVWAKHHGAKAPSRTPLPGGRASGWKRKIDGTWVRREP